MQDHKKYLEEADRKNAGGGLERVLVDFYTSLFDYQQARYAIYNELASIGGFLNETRLPKIDTGAIQLTDEEESSLREGMRDLLVLVNRYNEGMDFTHLQKAFAMEDNQSAVHIRLLLELDTNAMAARASDYKLGLDEFIFVLVNWAKPYFVAISEKRGIGASPDEWDREVCPVCGYLPDMAMTLDAEGGKRYLHCALCEATWAYKRMACAVCGSEDAENLGCFREEGDDRYRIDFCDTCRGYIKSVRIPKFEEPKNFDLTVENVLTVRLDASVMLKGYSRP